MALKLINRKDALLKNEGLGISLKLGRLLPEHVSEMRGLLYESRSPKTTVAIYAMRECMSELTLNGEEYDPRTASYLVDTNDKDTVVSLTGITALLVEELLATEEIKKKLLALRETSLQEKEPNAAGSAQDQTGG